MKIRLPKFLRGVCLKPTEGHAAPNSNAAEPQPLDGTPEAAARAAMVETQLMAPGRDITSSRVLKAMSEVPRHEFVPESLAARAYQDQPLPIGHEQTISQPFIVAFMTQALELNSNDRVLEIGAGSGYQAAVLSRLVAEVYTIEIVAALALRATSTLERLGYANVHVQIGDGYQGWPQHAPYDAVIVTCAPSQVPQALVDQMREGGRMIIPVGERPDQELYLLRKQAGNIEQSAILRVRFVPMTGGG